MEPFPQPLDSIGKGTACIDDRADAEGCCRGDRKQDKGNYRRKDRQEGQGYYEQCRKAYGNPNQYDGHDQKGDDQYLVDVLKGDEQEVYRFHIVEDVYPEGTIICLGVNEPDRRGEAIA